MEFNWRLYNYRRSFAGIYVLHTRLSLLAETPVGQVKLQLRVAWDVPMPVLWYGLFLSGAMVRSNYCRTFTVVLLSESAALEQRTIEYFDGESSELRAADGAYRVLYCDRKWRASATKLVNRYGADIEWNQVALQKFMERRVLNAYGLFCT